MTGGWAYRWSMASFANPAADLMLQSREREGTSIDYSSPAPTPQPEARE